MAQWVKCQPTIHVWDLSLNPQNSFRIPISLHRDGRQRQENPQRFTEHLDLHIQQQTTETPLKQDRRQGPASLTKTVLQLPHTCSCTHMRTDTHTYACMLTPGMLVHIYNANTRGEGEGQSRPVQPMQEDPMVKSKLANPLGRKLNQKQCTFQ